jgi:uncharacterized cupin superfamily protein
MISRPFVQFPKEMVMTDLAAKLIRNIDGGQPGRDVRRDPLYEGRLVRLSPGTAASKMAATYCELAPGKRLCPYHLHHAQEEMFVILEGTGTLRVAGEMLPVGKGDVIFIPAGPDYPHQLINSSDRILKYLALSTNETPEICEYPDSGKFLAEASLDHATPFEVIDRKGEGRAYWDGEP